MHVKLIYDHIVRNLKMLLQYISLNKVLHINSLCCISRSVGFKGSSRSTGFDDKQTIINPINFME